MRTVDQNSSWAEVVFRLGQRQESYVLVTLLGVQGSTPRDSGTKMVVTGSTSYGSIGGGHLEFKAGELARDLLTGGESAQVVHHFALGPSLGQCCGGRTSVLFEVMIADAISLMLFGAGHVGRALAGILAGLPVRVQWVDSRADVFPGDLPDNMTRVTSEVPVDAVADMPAGSYFLVLTHNHQLDFELCEAILKRNDFRYLGLIGSATKWARFRRQLVRKGFDEALVDRIQSPVGLPSIPGKAPMEVAVSIAGQLVHEYQKDRTPVSTRQGVVLADLERLVRNSQV